MSNNYGDVSLNLGPGWSRNNIISGQDFMNATVGHENGKADLQLKGDRADERHQFQWCHPKDDVRLQYLRSKRYEFVKASEWDKNPLLWDWTPEGNCLFRDQWAMARPEALYLAEKKLQDRQEAEKRKRADRDEADEFAARKLGDKAYDDEGRELRPTKRTARG